MDVPMRFGTKMKILGSFDLSRRAAAPEGEEVRDMAEYASAGGKGGRSGMLIEVEGE